MRRRRRNHRRDDNNAKDIGISDLLVSYRIIYWYSYFIIDLNSPSSNNNNNDNNFSPESIAEVPSKSIYGRIGFTQDSPDTPDTISGASSLTEQVAPKSVYDRVDLNQVLVYGETSLKTE